MDILIFDMDGVLLEANGYHRALQRTVQLIGESLSLDSINLTLEQIHTFESLGISSEWHSSALCHAFLKMQLLSGVASPSLQLEPLFSLLEEQPFELPAIKRGSLAIDVLCQKRGVDPGDVRPLLIDSENMDRSLTMQRFQELVLGSEAYQKRYHQAARLNTQSYLELFDSAILSPDFSNRINSWAQGSSSGAAIMTNRPSSGPGEHGGSPEAELGLALVRLTGLPLVGYGEIAWLAESLQAEPGTLAKPNPAHALAAILGAAGLDKENSLTLSAIDPTQWPDPVKKKLDGGNIAVFEDTPGGIAAVCSAGESLRRSQIDVKLRLIGIAKGKTKKTALASQGAEIFPDINTALEHFGPFA